MKILSVETSGKTFSIALSEGKKTLASLYYNNGNMHSENLLSSIEKITSDANTSLKDIDKFAVSTGPGSFTGIRIGMTVVKTLAQFLNKPVFAANTLEILESSFVEISGVKIITAIDALRNEVYVKERKKVIIKNIHVFIESLKKIKEQVMLIGNASAIYREAVEKNLKGKVIFVSDFDNMPQAHKLAQLAYLSKKNYSYDQVEPLYIRKSWAEEKIASI
ncbi:MAG: tRNA (adenosine(37)-N6)-threonylcarbamoyltransferase complex dimerization subunit type 1 TsaB [Elusimicrobiota bacterium]|jgi:tRNA threonylcarbamoyladenosine biosynthesis protein TsaB|nr:tRNA (adenosine(37)-N6)-threonylcarbamoyltransferase complex dimerization subunit type 1 TsaB [Elusimicrobiota bacterium]